MGHRPEGLRRRARDPVRPRPEPRARPGEPLRRAGLPRRVPRQCREAADLRRGHAAAAPRGATSTGRFESRLQRVDASATPEHASRLQLARQVDAAVGLIGAPIVLLGLVGSGVFAWLRYGRDPVYLDDPSIHMAGPPRDLTPAAGAFVVHGGPTRRALTAAMLDLASRGDLTFREESELLGLKKKVGIEVGPAAADDFEEARRARNAARPMGPAERLARQELTQSVERRRLHQARRAARIRGIGAEVRQGPRGRGHPQRLVPGETVEGRRRAGWSAARSPWWPASSGSSPA